VIARLREVKHPKIYFAVDGPRTGNSNDIALVTLTHKLAQDFDWDCEVYTLFQETNLGCGAGVSTAIDWVLKNEESVIVLEDDVLPDQSFFPFCIELLERFKENDQVFAISGCNFAPKQFLVSSDSYRFAPSTHVWGWATWKRSWESYEFDISNWKSEITFSQLREQLGGSWISAMLWSKMFDLVAKQKIDTWDYQLAFASLKSNSFVATSNVNLTENMGFGPGSTHTGTVPKFILPTQSINFPLAHPPVAIDRIANNWIQTRVYGATILGGLSLLKKYIKLSSFASK
jgi:hypothetical protein